MILHLNTFICKYIRLQINYHTDFLLLIVPEAMPSKTGRLFFIIIIITSISNFLFINK